MCLKMRQLSYKGGYRFPRTGNSLFRCLGKHSSQRYRGGTRVKSHHNVGGLPDAIQFELVEPLRYLFKDEVREVGKELGIPAHILERHPFPGPPGLGVRIVGEVTEESLDMAREANAIVEEEIHRAGLYNELWQVFAVLLDVRSVGVSSGMRT